MQIVRRCKIAKIYKWCVIMFTIALEIECARNNLSSMFYCSICASTENSMASMLLLSISLGFNDRWFSTVLRMLLRSFSFKVDPFAWCTAMRINEMLFYQLFCEWLTNLTLDLITKLLPAWIANAGIHARETLAIIHPNPCAHGGYDISPYFRGL